MRSSVADGGLRVLKVQAWRWFNRRCLKSRAGHCFKTLLKNLEECAENKHDGIRDQKLRKAHYFLTQCCFDHDARNKSSYRVDAL
ncbi:hypothetical protein VTN77DRAFT_3514 [Rasamsonia byssochlamydoides]|uniref:uncharacterized protein n=1 Tax=Rasamsonia byssochlamydoides TaxID=89139 RepID=UPI0037422F0F